MQRLFDYSSQFLKKYLEISDFIFWWHIKDIVNMEYCLKMVPSAYCWVDNKFINITHGVVNFHKYQTITDLFCAIGMKILAVSLKWLETKEKNITFKAFVDKYAIF